MERVILESDNNLRAMEQQRLLIQQQNEAMHKEAERQKKEQEELKVCKNNT